MPNFIMKFVPVCALFIICVMACSSRTGSEDNAGSDPATYARATLQNEGVSGSKFVKDGPHTVQLEKLDLGDELVGHFSLALLATELNKRQQALEHIRRAKTISRHLLKNPPESRENRKFRFAKLNYKAGTQTRSYFIPILNDEFHFVVYKHAFHKEVETHIKTSDASVITLAINIDATQAAAHLGSAEAAINKDHFSVARTELSRFLVPILLTEEIDPDPFRTAENHLILAAGLVKTGNFGAANYALKRAKNGLDELVQNNRAQVGNASLSRIGKDIDRIILELENEKIRMSTKDRLRLELKSTLRTLRTVQG